VKDVRCEKIHMLENGNSSFGRFLRKKWRAKAKVKTENKYKGEQSIILENKSFQRPQQQSNKV